MKITPTTNAKGEIDYGHAWRYYQMGFIDIYGNKIVTLCDGKWRFVSNKEGRMLWDAKESRIPSV